MRIVYEAVVKLKIILENNDENLSLENIPTQETLDNAIKEIINDELGKDASCEIDISSKYGLSGVKNILTDSIEQSLEGLKVKIIDTITDDDGREGIVSKDNGDRLEVIIDGEDFSKGFYRTETELV